MAELRMVPVASASTAFEAKVLAARLGSEGIVWQLRGNIDGVYPLGVTEVLVGIDDEDRARELLLADDVESAFDDDAVVATGPGEIWVLVAGGLLLAVFVLARVLSLG